MTCTWRARGSGRCSLLLPAKARRCPGPGIRGFLTLWSPQRERSEESGCVVATHAQGRGYATEASEAIVRAAFAAGVDRLTAMTLPDNAAALHVLDKLEFMPQGETTFEGRRYAFFVRVGS